MESFDKNLFLDRCYSVIQQMISNCKKTKMHEMGVTFVKDMPDYIPADEKKYYKKALMAILENKEMKCAGLYKEYCFKN